MKELYLVCNAHLDPVWQWTWQEGAAETLSTFKSAADLCEEYDYIFCHNEQWIYEFVEEYDPILFKRIQKLVEEGKWRIMGGWFLQPDVLLPAGESLVRQIQHGKKYFQEKFGMFPTSAIGFDAFGHSRGLVQVIKKCGQDSYILVRPQKHLLDLPNDYFIWEGYDGSEVKAIRCPGYNTFLGRALEETEKYVQENQAQEVGIMLWGVGNHGGGPSRKDLSDLKKFAEESELDVQHSYPEEVFQKIDFKNRYNKSLITCMPGCYTSLNQMKQKYIRLENMLYATEKMATQTYLENPGYIYPERELFDACKQMLKIQFHDILSGTVIRSGEKSALRVLDGAYNTLENVQANTFFYLLRNEKKANPGEYCICVYNAFPYEREENVEFEFSMEKNSNTAFKPVITLYDDKDNEIPIQIVKEESNVSIDCRKHIVFNYKLKPLSINRFRLTTKLIPNDHKTID
jgi:alpha-mannosidase